MGSVKEAAMEEQQPLLNKTKKPKNKSKNKNKNKARRQQGQGYGSTPDQEVEDMEDSEEVEVDSPSQREGEGNRSQQVEEVEVEESQWQRVGKVLRESPPEFFFGLFLLLLATYGHYSNARYGKEGVPYKLVCYLSQQLFNKSTKHDFVPDEL